MATIKYLLQSKSTNAQIYIRLSLGRNKVYKRKTSLSINPNEWSIKNHQPKNTLPENKNLASKLRKLNDFILDQLNQANINGVDIDGNWLQSKINLYFNKSEIDKLFYIAEYGKYFLKNLKYKTNDKTKKIGVMPSTQKKYQTIVNKLISFDVYKKRNETIGCKFKI